MRQWVKQADIDEGHAPGVSTAEAKRSANWSRRTASSNEPTRFSNERHLPSGRNSTANTRSSRVHRRQPRRDRRGQEARSRVHLRHTVQGGAGRWLRAPTTPPGPASRRHARSATPSSGQALRALWEANYRVYGARKLRKAARRAGHAFTCRASGDSEYCEAHRTSFFSISPISSSLWLG